MKQVFIKKAQHARLFLFFAGWGADEHLFNYPVAEGYDYLLCFDYRTLDFDYALLDGYQSIHLAAWSMGVWAASCIFSGKDYPWESLVAINGTPCPVHDCYGIPEAVFGGTVLHFSEQTLVRFRRRMCGSAEEVKLFLAHQPYRSLDELHEELALLYQEVKKRGLPVLAWSKAIVGVRDNIFPAVSQQRYWEGKTDLVLLDIGHYSDAFFASYLKGKEEEWIKS